MNNMEMTRVGELGPQRLEDFSRDSLRPVSIGYLAWLGLGLSLVIVTYVQWQASPISSIRPALMVYYLLVVVHVIFRFRTGGRANILAPDILFLLFYTMFHLGYVTLYALDSVPYSRGIFFYKDSIPRALFVVNLGLLGFLFGYELMGPKGGQPHPRRLRIPTQTWCVFGILVMCIALAMHLLALWQIGPETLARYGYGAIQNAKRYTSARVAMILAQSNPLLVFGATIYMVASALRYRKLFHSKPALALMIMAMSIYLLEGDRGPVLLLGIPVLLIRHYLIKAIRIRHLILWFVGAMVVFGALSVVRKAKNVFDPGRMWSEYKYQQGAGKIGWRNPFLEMGSSFKVVTITCQDVPSAEPYWQGKSYFAAALHTIPFLEGYLIRRGIHGFEAAEHWYWPSKWVTITYFGFGHAGQAFTIATEGYLNFGFPGAFLELLFFGVFVRWATLMFCRKPSAARAIIMFGYLAVSYKVIRNHLHTITGLCFQILVIAILLGLFLRNEPESASEEYETAEAVPA